MAANDLIRQIFVRLNRYKWVVFGGGLLVATLLFLFAQSRPTVYSVRSTLFPLTASADNNSAASRLGELIGGGTGTKSLSEEATINIEEVAKSRKTREAVVAEKISALSNKNIAALLIENYNKHRPFLKPKIEMPKTADALIYTGAALLNDAFTAKFNKNSLLEINFSSSDQNLVTPVSYILIEKITLFYKELKIKKAKFDFDFTEKKVDSLQEILDTYDRRQIQLNKTTLFVPADRLQYSLPKDNLQMNKLRVLGQRNGAAANREDALWRLQKVTPIIEILDKPERPFSEIKPSKIIYGIGGFVLGCFAFAFLFIARILYRYLNGQLQASLFSETVSVTTTSTTL